MGRRNYKVYKRRKNGCDSRRLTADNHCGDPLRNISRTKIVLAVLSSEDVSTHNSKWVIVHYQQSEMTSRAFGTFEPLVFGCCKSLVYVVYAQVSIVGVASLTKQTKSGF